MKSVTRRLPLVPFSVRMEAEEVEVGIRIAQSFNKCPKSALDPIKGGRVRGKLRPRPSVRPRWPRTPLSHCQALERTTFRFVSLARELLATWHLVHSDSLACSELLSRIAVLPGRSRLCRHSPRSKVVGSRLHAVVVTSWHDVLYRQPHWLAYPTIVLTRIRPP